VSTDPSLTVTLDKLRPKSVSPSAAEPPAHSDLDR
jgi:hypothetical protein